MGEKGARKWVRRERDKVGKDGALEERKEGRKVGMRTVKKSITGYCGRDCVVLKIPLKSPGPGHS